ncbi:MAG: type II secretion system GspH family protein [Planctomycetes bacterium]|nr:type II secretion system GspH family protein [Planctomycetota bacterium]
MPYLPTVDRRFGFSLTELIVVVAILGVLAALMVPRLIGHSDTSKRAACYANQGEIELQVKLWRRNQGSYPAANLSNIDSNPAYFPDGLPVCPVDGTAYTIDTSSGLVTGHTH